MSSEDGSPVASLAWIILSMCVSLFWGIAKLDRFGGLEKPSMDRWIETAILGDKFEVYFGEASHEPSIIGGSKTRTSGKRISRA